MPQTTCLHKFWSKKFVWLTIAAVTSQMFLVANTISWTSSAIPKMKHLPKDSDVEGNLGNFFLYGNIIGSIISFFTLIYFPRKVSMILHELILLASWILLIFKTQVIFLYIGRLLAGIAASSIALHLPVYEAECFHPVDRQISGGFMCLNTAAGLWVEYSIAPFITYDQVIIFNLVPIVLFLISFPCYGTETPFHLVKTGNLVKSKEVMDTFWSEDSNQDEILTELDNIRETIKEEREMGVWGAFKSIFTDKSNFKACLIALMLISFYSASGFIQLAMYMQLILINAKVTEISSGFSSAVIGTVKLAGAFLALPSINFIGVKKTLIMTLTGNALSLIALGSYFFAKASGDDVSPVYWLPLTSLALYFLFGLMGSSMLPYVMRGEVLPRHLRGPGGATTDIISSAFAVAANYIYITFSNDKIYMSLWIYAAITIFFVLYIHFCVPETKDKTLHEIQEQLKS